MRTVPPCPRLVAIPTRWSLDETHLVLPCSRVSKRRRLLSPRHSMLGFPTVLFPCFVGLF